MKNFNLLKSVRNFKREVAETRILINALEGQIIGIQAFLKLTKARSNPNYEKVKQFLEINDKQFQKLYELGFIAFFANFECFMYEFLKDLFKKYPKSFQSEKIAKFEDLKDFKTTKEVKNYFIDSLAIEKSYDIEAWSIFLQQRFGIPVFNKSKDLRTLVMLNSIRNLILHSGSKTNSKFRTEMKKILKTPVPLGEYFKLDRKKYFGILHYGLQLLIKNIEKN